MLKQLQNAGRFIENASVKSKVSNGYFGATQNCMVLSGRLVRPVVRELPAEDHFSAFQFRLKSAADEKVPLSMVLVKR
jgi:hypothetical protein